MASPRRSTAAGHRDPERTRERILASALREFAGKGFAGARVDAIARRAAVNKRMLYHYFGHKRGLFSAVLGRKLVEREALLASAPQDPADILAYWFDALLRDPDWTRLLQWEALEGGERPLAQEGRRRRGARQAVRSIASRQAGGFLRRDLDSRQLLLSMIALTVYPMVFPQVTRFVTGRSASDPVFQSERKAFLRQFAALLRSPSRS